MNAAVTSVHPLTKQIARTVRMARALHNTGGRLAESVREACRLYETQEFSDLIIVALFGANAVHRYGAELDLWTDEVIDIPTRIVP